MFNMIGIGERAGSGVPDIYAVWESQGWEEPVVEEQYNPDRTVLTLVFSSKQAEKNKRKKQAERVHGDRRTTKTANNERMIVDFLTSAGSGKTSDIARHINLSMPRTRAILSGLVSDGKIQSEGGGKLRRYCPLPKSPVQ